MTKKRLPSTTTGRKTNMPCLALALGLILAACQAVPCLDVAVCGLVSLENAVSFLHHPQTDTSPV